ncbi:MAG: GNAT family N-acetyltransferase [Firmicutes bacterium]|nr:GNAT family N-acetyltransferase [Bacillota bacterium]
MVLEISFDAENNRAVARDRGQEIGECTFSPSDNIWVIDHTFVDDKYEGQGIAKRLVDQVVGQARNQGKKISATCPYAIRLFAGSDDYDDVVVK